MLSVLIPTLNERDNIVECLQSVGWADEVVVVDSGSTDHTRELAQSCGAKVVRFDWNRKAPKKKNWALANVPWENEWVLILDADERVTAALAQEIKQALARPLVDGFFINRRFMFQGKWLRHCGYYPSWNLRLFRHRKGRYEELHSGDTCSGDNEVHEHLVLDGQAAELRHELLHFAYPDIYTWLEKHNRYSNWEAALEVDGYPSCQSGIGKAQVAKRRLRTFSRRLPCRSLLRFIYSYVLKQGFRDGYEGYVFCRLLAMYEMLSAFKAKEMVRRGSVEGRG